MATRKKTVKKDQAPAPSTSALLNHIAVIDPEVKSFIGGLGIPRLARDNELYIKRINPNGTIVLAYSDSLAEVGTVFAKDIEVTEKLWERVDDIEEEPLFDVRIMGVPARMDNINLNKARLHIPDEKIIIDYDHEGCVATAKKAWSLPTDKAYVLVLQDDAELCDNFVHYCNLILQAQSDAIISLFPIQLMTRYAVTHMPKTPYIKTNCTSGVGTIMPSDWVEPCIASWREELKGDDTNINAWAEANDKTIITTIPAIIQHLGEHSVFNPSRSIGSTDFYRKDVSPYDWGNTNVINYEQIIR